MHNKTYIDSKIWLSFDFDCSICSIAMWNFSETTFISILCRKSYQKILKLRLDDIPRFNNDYHTMRIRQDYLQLMENKLDNHV